MNLRIAEVNPLDIKFTKAAHNAFLVVSGVPFIKENGLVKRIVKITVETEANLHCGK